jgi:YD repeat-containing protein
MHARCRPSHKPGRATSIQDALGHYVNRAYDPLGRVTLETTETGQRGLTTDEAGQLILIGWDGGPNIAYDRLVTGEVWRMRENPAYANFTLATFAYDDQGRRTSLTRGNGASTTYGFDAASRLTQLVQNLNGTTNDLTLDFTYNPAGEIVTNTRSNDAYSFTGHANANIADTLLARVFRHGLAGRDGGPGIGVVAGGRGNWRRGRDRREGRLGRVWSAGQVAAADEGSDAGDDGRRAEQDEAAKNDGDAVADAQPAVQHRQPDERDRDHRDGRGGGPQDRVLKPGDRREQHARASRIGERERGRDGGSGKKIGHHEPGLAYCLAQGCHAGAGRSKAGAPASAALCAQTVVAVTCIPRFTVIFCPGRRLGLARGTHAPAPAPEGQRQAAPKTTKEDIFGQPNRTKEHLQSIPGDLGWHYGTRGKGGQNDSTREGTAERGGAGHRGDGRAGERNDHLYL